MSDFLAIINDKLKKQQAITEEMGQVSTYYPEVASIMTDTQTVYGTWVRICRGGKWYKVLCIESHFGTHCSSEMSLYRLIKAAHQIQYLYVLNGQEQVDELQITEIERLNQIYGNNKG